ncbi:hydroxyethylthiazole kinase [Halobacillus karajensis]|uniref:Hydroxyethylthiazole kinase n=1 Tax=Halobacillus karajensis TaxID=195088 RepID=A0A059NX37_9BACI|nr:hydroxyethylthiazole kinase [Halobacillus karajensis]CDQ18618.1 Hydroxyethylthiazole kinase [Halobacillus karajensis]CDQ23310.1 Hydroxyethylthiazole kinase [Halobacillus karajensis]CDQ26792.1 Hydroxyethylthiazole kinase [Halobacillus karajensis]SEH49076.1 hydroxyethylthiazole kinase [Halobacillus karajensis]
MVISLVKQVRKERPLIHNMTNTVVMNFTANGLLAFGGSPIMANAKQEAPDVTRLSQGLLLNIGTLHEDQVQAMILAGKTANEIGIPVVLDPVGAPATTYRSEVCRKILDEVQPTVIKGNAGELAHLVGMEVETKGVDSTGKGDLISIVKEVSEEYGTGAVCTGEKDVGCIEGDVFINETGHPLLGQITGSGCLLGSLLAAGLSVAGDTSDKILATLNYYGQAAERAASRPDVEGPGTFLPRFIDSLAAEVEHAG